MVAFNKFEVFADTDLGNKVHDISGTAAACDQLECYLSAATPSASLDSVKADLAEIATGNGYTGPEDTQNVGTASAGTLQVVGTDITITASGGSITAFRYTVLQNTTPASPLDPLIGWWDYGSTVTLASGESFTIDFGATMFTIA